MPALETIIFLWIPDVCFRPVADGQ